MIPGIMRILPARIQSNRPKTQLYRPSVAKFAKVPDFTELRRNSPWGQRPGSISFPVSPNNDSPFPVEERAAYPTNFNYIP